MKTVSIDTKKSASLIPGHLVKWWDNGWRTGRLVSVGYRWCRVEYIGRNKKIAREELESAE